MNEVTVAAAVFIAVTMGAIGFQFALAFGAPWGSYAMGGNFPSRFPASMRIAAAMQGIVLGLLAGIVLARAGLALHSWASAASWMIWIVVVLSGVSLVLNTITSSVGERRIWVPVAVAMLGSSLVVALAG